MNVLPVSAALLALYYGRCLRHLGAVGKEVGALLDPDRELTAYIKTDLHAEPPGVRADVLEAVKLLIRLRCRDEAHALRLLIGLPGVSGP